MNLGVWYLERFKAFHCCGDLTAALSRCYLRYSSIGDKWLGDKKVGPNAIVNYIEVKSECEKGRESRARRVDGCMTIVNRGDLGMACELQTRIGSKVMPEASAAAAVQQASPLQGRAHARSLADSSLATSVQLPRQGLLSNVRLLLRGRTRR